jgi:hypothetical protein
MAGPDYNQRGREWEQLCNYFERGTIGEAGLELREAIARRTNQELQRWKALVEEFPYAVSGVNPAEALNSTEQACQLFVSFMHASNRWLVRELVNRDGDFWQEMASMGCYWVRFKHKADLIRYIEAFAEQLHALGFKVDDDCSTM